MPKLFVICGLPGSGKSDKAKELSLKYNAKIISSNELRTEMYGDEDHHQKIYNKEVFPELRERTRENLINGNNVVYEATNFNCKKRIALLQHFNDIPCEKIAVLVATPYKDCVQGNVERGRKVPREVIDSIYRSFWIPGTYEGFDKVQIEYSQGAKGSRGSPMLWLNQVMNYDKYNSFSNNLKLGDHSRETWFNMCRRLTWKNPTDNSLAFAAMLHDEGRLFTEKNPNYRGDTVDGHEHVSAYDSLFFDYDADKLYTAQLIQWHVRPYAAWKDSEEILEREKKMLGEEMFNDIMLLNECDYLSL